MTKVIISTRLNALAGGREALMAAFDGLHDAVAEEPGTEVFVMHAARDEPDVVCFYEVYRDDAALAAHREGAAVKDLVTKLGDLLAAPPEIAYLSLVRSKGLALQRAVSPER